MCLSIAEATSKLKVREGRLAVRLKSGCFYLNGSKFY